uniref:Putative secreted protein n=1 Tax=Ixodes ricinus TaxID=34613 RepID=A0A6B0UEQ9_IXORI
MRGVLVGCRSLVLLHLLAGEVRQLFERIHRHQHGPNVGEYLVFEVPLAQVVNDGFFADLGEQHHVVHTTGAVLVALPVVHHVCR